MGYTIEYIGRFTLNKPLTKEQFQFLKDFSATRHYHRVWKPEDNNGINWVDPEDKFAPNYEDEEYQKVLYTKPYDNEKRKAYDLEHYNCIDYNGINPGMPGLWCQWIPTEENQGIEWDGCEKFYEAQAWLKFIIENYLKPWGYILNGRVKIHFGYREYPFDEGILEVKDNEVSAYEAN